MPYFTDRELDFLTSLQSRWRWHYLLEFIRLLGVDAGDGLNRGAPSNPSQGAERVQRNHASLG